MLHALAARRCERGIDVRLERNALAAAQTFVGGDHDAGAAVGDAARERLGRKAAEHDRMHGADARAREHRHRGLGNHRHVDRDAIALAHAERLERIRALTHALVQLAIRHSLRQPRIVAFPQDCSLVAALGEVAVETVRRHVELAVVEPADAEVLFVVAGVLHLRVGLDPVEAPADARPERVRVAHRLLIQTQVVGVFQVGEGGEIFRNLVNLGRHWASACRTRSACWASTALSAQSRLCVRSGTPS